MFSLKLSFFFCTKAVTAWETNKKPFLNTEQLELIQSVMFYLQNHLNISMPTPLELEFWNFDRMYLKWVLPGGSVANMATPYS